VIWGNTVLAGAGQNPARQAAILGGLPPETPAYTVSNVCGAGLQAIFLAGQSLALGVSDGIIAGGSESATRTPQMFSKSVETPFEERDPVDSLLYDGLWCNLTGQHMGQLAEELAKKEKISRIAQDQFALESHRKAAAGQFADEIIAVMLADQKVFAADERIRRRLNLENLQPCRALLRKMEPSRPAIRQFLLTEPLRFCWAMKILLKVISSNLWRGLSVRHQLRLNRR
jgi:acetyl-CoA acetyltransferase